MAIATALGWPNSVQIVLAHIEKEPRPLHELRPDVSPELSAVMAKMLAKDPARRYQTPGEAADALAPFTGQAPGPCRRAFPRRRLVRAGVLLAAVCGVLLARAVLRVQTDKGEFVIETDDPDVAVQIDRAGVKVRDHSNGREYLLKVGRHDLRSGEYDIDVSELPDGLEVSARHFRLTRGGKVRVTARVRRRASPEAEKAELDKLRGRWKPVRGEYNGQTVPAEIFKRVRSVAAAGPEKKAVVDVAGIYKLEQDTLTLCVSEQKDDRPTEFATRPRSGHRLIVFRRVPARE